MVQNVLVCPFYSVNYYNIFNNKCMWLYQPMFSPCGLIWSKVLLFNGTFSAVHTSSIVCLQVWVCLHTCVCLCLSCVRAGLQGHLRPWFPAQDEWALLYHCLGQQWSRLRLAIFGGGRGYRGADRACRSCILHPWQGSGVIPFCIHLSAVSDRVVDPGLIKMSGF